MILYFFKNKHVLYATIFLTVVFLSIGTVLAQINAGLPEGVTQEQISSAMTDLSSATGEAITTKEQAIAACNQEKYLEICANIGKKHGL